MKLLNILIAASMALFTVTASYAHETEAHDGLIIEKVWARETGGRTMSSAIYMTIKNPSHTGDTLVDVASDAAKMVQIHQSVSEDGIMKMNHIEGLPIAAGSKVSLKPGSYHIMLMKLAKPLNAGDVFMVTLSFEKAGDITVPVTVSSMSGMHH